MIAVRVQCLAAFASVLLGYSREAKKDQQKPVKQGFAAGRGGGKQATGQQTVAMPVADLTL